MMSTNRIVVLSVLAMASLVFTACAATLEPTTVAPTVVESSPPQAVVTVIAGTLPPQEALYEKVPPDLCPPDKVCEGQVRFADPMWVPYEGKYVKEVWVQPGLFANEQGELFRMDVIGATADAAKLYTEYVQVCLDQIFTGEVTAGEPSQPGFDRLPDEFGANPEDLSIEVYLLGLFDPKQKTSEEVISQLFGLSAEEWAGMLKEMGLTPEQARPEESKQDYLVDFVIDPSVNNGSTHYYPQKSATNVQADVSVAGGGGSVRAELYRDMVSAGTTTVTKGGDRESDTLSDGNLGIGATYGLAVKGNDSGTYRVSGRIRVPGWSALYEEAPPPCTAEDICLKLFPGQSTTLPISATTDEMPIPELDVLLLFDVSSSMDDEIDTVRQNASDIMEAVKGMVPAAAFGVASFSDYPYSYNYAGYSAVYGDPGDYPWSPDLDITTDAAAVQDTLNSLGLRTGGDDPECYSRALSEAVSVAWRTGAKKVIVLFGDSVPHDTEFFQAAFGVNTGVDPGQDNDPGTGDDLVFTDVVAKLKDQVIEVIPINSAPGYEMARASFDYLATETGGQVFNLDAATDVPGAVVRGLEAATGRIDKLYVTPDDPTFSPWVTAVPEIHYDVGGGESRPFEVTITVPEGTSPGAYEFNLTVLGDGTIQEVFHVVLVVP